MKTVFPTTPYRSGLGRMAAVVVRRPYEPDFRIGCHNSTYHHVPNRSTNRGMSKSSDPKPDCTKKNGGQ